MEERGKRVWNRFAFVYERALGSSRELYSRICARILPHVKDRVVLELGTGPGIIALKVGGQAREMIATDYAEKMIAAAKRREAPDTLRFEVADARCLSYPSHYFDVVIIANTLHVMPDASLALQEIRRVLKDDGLLIAPNYIQEDLDLRAKLRYTLYKRIGIGFEQSWSAEEYLHFLRNEGFAIKTSELLPATIPVLYVEAMKASSMKDHSQAADKAQETQCSRHTASRA
ncbi:MAG: class I SAM-dependent methyltransferase [Bacillota bacterium]|nr:class I SAM-dependent methyltransferase [Bacillota bacterium]